MKLTTILTATATILANVALLINAKRLDRTGHNSFEQDFAGEAPIKVADDPTDPVSPTIIEIPSNFGILNNSAPVMVGSPISIYYIFYGNFTDLEISRIENYAKHISGPSTKPNRWSVATQFYDDTGVHVNKVLKHGGSVRDWYSKGSTNISTTIFADDPTTSDLSRIIVSHIGDGVEGKFPYDPQGIYVVVTAPEVLTQDIIDGNTYKGYHFSYPAALTNGTVVTINHAFGQSYKRDKSKISLAHAPNGDTGRIITDVLVDIIHHEIFESISDPFPNMGWNDKYNLDYGFNEIGDVCQHIWPRSYPNLRYTESTLNSTGIWYNTIINGFYYALHDMWTFDKDNVQGCYSEVRDTRLNEFKGPRVAKNPVTATLGITNYTGPVYIPCRAYYIDRYHGGYTSVGDNQCHTWYDGFSWAGFVDVFAPLDVPDNYHVLSQNHAHYQWMKVDETNAITVYDDDVNPPTTANNRVFVVFQDNFGDVAGDES
ncbi:hypothetical protein HDU76_008164, partial [Blyttiomyces sp. JEL0837]